MSPLEAGAAFRWHLAPRLALQPFRHLGAVRIEFAVLSLREVDLCERLIATGQQHAKRVRHSSARR